MTEEKALYITDRDLPSLELEIQERLDTIKQQREIIDDLKAQVEILEVDSADIQKVVYLKKMAKEAKDVEEAQRKIINTICAEYYDLTGEKIKLDKAETKLSSPVTVTDKEGAFRWAVEGKQASFLILDEGKLIEYAKAVKDMKDLFDPIRGFMKFDEKPFVSIAKEL